METLEALSVASARPSPVDDTTYRDHALFFNGLLPLMDLASLIYATYLTHLFNVWLGRPSVGGERILMLIALLGPIVMYDRRFLSVASREQFGALCRCYLTGCLLLAMALVGALSIRNGFGAETIVLAATWLCAACALTAATRIIIVSAVIHSVRRGVLTEVVAIVGAGPRSERLRDFLRQSKPITPEILGVFDDEPTLSLVGEESAESKEALTGNIDALIALGKSRRIDWIFLALRHVDEERMSSILHRLKALAVPVALCPSTLDVDTAKRVDYIAGSMPVTLLQHPMENWRRRVRSAGQFLPRWIVTLVVVSATSVRSLWLRFRGAGVVPSQRALASRNTLVCELDNYELADFMKVAQDFGSTRFGYVVTPNADHFIRLHDDPHFRGLYSNAEYVLMDSRFLATVLRSMGGPQLPVCTGSDVTARLFDSCAANDRIVIVGGQPAQIQTLTDRFGLKNLAHHNPPMGFVHDEAAIMACIQFVEANAPFRYCLLAVGSPQQEVLAHRLRERGNARGLALCVGASIDFLTGVEKRAPAWMQRCSIEWLYRLMQNPQRLAKRYLIRGPRIFWLIRKTRFVLRKRVELEVVAPLRAA